MYKDARGLAVTLSQPGALDAYERALVAARTYRGDPIAPLDEAIALDPTFAAAHVTKALLLMTFFERRFAADAIAVLDAADAAMMRATPREKALAAAARLLATGEWNEGTQALDRILVDHPRDIVALQVAHLMDFFRGDALNLRNRVSRVLRHWPASAPGYSFVIGMHAFGLEECNQYPEAEAAGLRALALAPEDAWAVHAVTHVFEMQGRIGEGVAFLEERKRDWAGADNGFAFHNWWHLALFHMDRGDFAAALRIYDDVLAGAHELAVSRLDATSLLWRLRLEGADVGKRFDVVADAWEKVLEGEGGFYAFNDFHAALAFAATNREPAARRLREALDSAAWEKRSNGDMTRSVGLDLVEGIFAFGEGRHVRAMEKLAAARDIAARFGGSHAQRDVITLTLIEAARRAGEPRVAEHYAAERLIHKPASSWGARILARIEEKPREKMPA
ncbi:MAG TPA: tetratricopeptide repeat protein [Usitatibacter sp.]|nr:tetratricopeptide repeat protein [Usitatibacter sp.]